MEENKNIPTSRSVYVDPALHTELKALAHFRQQDIKVIVSNLLRDALDNLERDLIVKLTFSSLLGNSVLNLDSLCLSHLEWPTLSF